MRTHTPESAALTTTRWNLLSADNETPVHCLTMAVSGVFSGAKFAQKRVVAQFFLIKGEIQRGKEGISVERARPSAKKPGRIRPHAP